ncbi:hypothetical protein [Thalassospira sp. ER-Se-21-Dark]|nr:hypothetical protein [Thalassospira sp. ER-Se-21-Dark]
MPAAQMGEAAGKGEEAAHAPDKLAASYGVSLGVDTMGGDVGNETPG